MLFPRALMVLTVLAAGSQTFGQEPTRSVPPEPASPHPAQTAPNKTQPTTAQLVDRILQLLDKNKDGKISREEAKGSPLEVVFERLDRNHDGMLDRTELMQGRGIMQRDSATAPAPAPVPATTHPAPASEASPSTTPAPAKSTPALPPGMRGVVRDDIRLFLKKYDSNGDGKIDLRELRAVFEEVDRNRDGLVDKAELRQAAQHLIAATDPTAAAATRTANQAASTPLDKTTRPANPSGTRVAPSRTTPPTQPAAEQVKPSTLDIMILHLVRHYDVDKDGKLSWNEAQALLRDMDKNHDEALDADEMLQGILALWAPRQTEPATTSPTVSRPTTPRPRATAPDADALAAALLRRYDTNQDGRLDPLEWKALFESLDASHRGMLTRSELRRLFAQLLAGPGPSTVTSAAGRESISSEGRVTFIMTMYDTNGDGRISVEEAATTPLAAIFKQIDRDGDGYLSRQELMQAAKLLPVPAPGSKPRTQPRTPR